MFSQDAFNELKGLAPDAVVTRWKEPTASNISLRDKAERDFALARRMMHLANMAVDLRQDERKQLHRMGLRLRDEVIAGLERDEALRQEASNIAANDDLYFETFGRTSARAYMYDQGVINLQGDRLR